MRHILFIAIIFLVCERRSEKVIKASDETHLQPFKDRMEEFFAEGNMMIQEIKLILNSS